MEFTFKKAVLHTLVIVISVTLSGFGTWLFMMTFTPSEEITSSKETEYPLVSLSDNLTPNGQVFTIVTFDGDNYWQMEIPGDGTQITYTYMLPKAVKITDYSEYGDVVSESWVLYLPDKTIEKSFEIDNK